MKFGNGKKKSGDQIINQLQILGTSANWKRSRFTMDKDLSNVVKKVFVDLYLSLIHI